MSRITSWDGFSEHKSYVEIQEGYVSCKNLPFIVITSQGRRELPNDLRSNCVQLPVQYPDRESWKQIISGHFPADFLSASKLDELANYAAERAQLSVDQVLDAAYMASIDDQFDIQESLQLHYHNETSMEPEQGQARDRPAPAISSPGYDIFLSYAASDWEVAAELRDAFVKNGMTCFMTEKDIIVASLWETSIRDAILSSESVLLLLTPRSIDRPWILLESGAAWALGKRIIPALVHVTPDDLIDPIRKFQARVVETTAQKRALISELKKPNMRIQPTAKSAAPIVALLFASADA
jgi:hypothetical protein